MSDDIIQPDTTDDDLRTIIEEIDDAAPLDEDEPDDNNKLRRRIMALEDKVKQLDNQLKTKIRINNRLMSDIECDGCLYEKLHNGVE